MFQTQLNSHEAQMPYRALSWKGTPENEVKKEEFFRDWDVFNLYLGQVLQSFR